MPFPFLTAARWFVLAWLCLAQTILPTRQVHAHEGGEVRHSRFEHHCDECEDGEGMPGRHAHFLVLGCECHIPLPPYDEPPGYSEEDGFAVIPAEQIHVAADVAVADFADIVIPAAIACEVATDCSWARDLPPPDPHFAGKACRLLFVSLTL